MVSCFLFFKTGITISNGQSTYQRGYSTPLLEHFSIITPFQISINITGVRVLGCVLLNTQKIIMVNTI